jgi:hypothetical protein
MIARAAAAALAAVAIGLSAPAAHAQGMVLQIEIRNDNTRPIRPHGAVNTLQDFMTALAACWSPPPLDARRQPLDLTFQVSFKRSGELFGKPRVVNFARSVTDEERQLYYTAVAEAVDRCVPMPFTESMGGAVAGRTFRVNFLDRRNSRKAEVSWLTMTTS